MQGVSAVAVINSVAGQVVPLAQEMSKGVLAVGCGRCGDAFVSCEHCACGRRLVQLLKRFGPPCYQGSAPELELL